MSKKNKKKQQKVKDNQQEQPLTNDQVTEEQTTTEVREETTGEQQELTTLAAERDELKDKYLRLFAEFENFRKRTLREKLDLMKTAGQETMEALLPVLDDFDRAKTNADDPATEETFSEGVSLVYNKLYSILQSKGLEPMESNGVVFDADLHEAVTEIPAPSEDLKGRVVDTVQKGYKLGDRIIRHAKVVVGK